MSPVGNGSSSARQRLRVVTYNVHACIGNDGKFSPKRIAEVLQELEADFVAIQELEDRVLGTESVSEFLARSLGMHPYRGATLKRQDAHYGNLLLSRRPARSMQRHDISVLGREPRGIIDARYSVFDRKIRILVTHFGLKAAERRKQVDALLQIAAGGESDIDLLAGDLNEWWPMNRTLRALGKRFGTMSRHCTWPARRPVLALDRIFVSPRAIHRTVHVADSKPARWASDHLPLVCDLELSG